MSLQALLVLGINASIFLAVLVVGMRVGPGDLLHVLSRPSQLARALLALNVVGPVVAVLVCKTFSLHPAVIVALVTLAIAPVSNLFTLSILPLVVPENAPYARGLLFASTVLSVGLTPLSVEVIDLIFGGSEHVSPLSVAQVVCASMLLPLGVGLAFGRWWPAARRWIPVLQRGSSLLLLACAVVIIAGTWSLMASLVRQGTLAAIVVVTLVDLVAGHVLGGPSEDGRTVLAHATAARHPGVAIAVATLTDQPLAPIGVLLAVLVSSVAMVPYTIWRKRRRAARPPPGVRPPARAEA
jgi:BASS family bile acid:Na+ symporter